ncbi:AraC family transcriptional regulator [Vibrio profundum]|uniref:AraC family transcriptional regulator n=1 Tax=Vibrio profundum TaxID=2910247 RepID=UPI003D141B26
MNYEERIDAVVDSIGQNLDEELSLDDLCEIACFSKFHFHRIFTAYTGLSLQQYIRWLRLKRAAHQLLIDQKATVLSVAITAGFESHEAFSRVFKKVSGMTPKQFRANGSWDFWDKSPYTLCKRRIKFVHVTIEEKSSRRLAVVEHRGSPKYVAQSVNKLIDWAKKQPIDLKPSPGNAFGFGYSDPNTTEPEEFKFDLGRVVPESLRLDDSSIVEKRIPAGRYAISVHKGSRNNLGDTIYPILREWLPSSGETLADFPCLFCYHNFDYEVAETELITEIWFLLEAEPA